MAKGAPIHKLTQPDASLVNSSGVLMVRLQEMFDWAQGIHNPENIDGLHNMRIAAKRLRYTMELFAPCFGTEFRDLLKTIEEIQERIGAIHDCEILVAVLDKSLVRESEKERNKALRKGGGPPPFLAAEGIMPLITAKQEERARLYREFLQFWDSLPPDDLFEQLLRQVQGATHSVEN